MEAFHEAFAEKSAYVVMFISEAYVSKAWPNHERRSALSRMIKEEDEYILPVRFDGTRVPGLPTDSVNASTPSRVSCFMESHAQNQKLRAARDLLLPRLMSGEIAV